MVCGGGTIEVVAVTNQAQNGCTTTFTVIWDAAPLGLSCPPTPLAYTTSFQAVDTTDPVLSGCPGNLTVDCNDPIPAPANVTASDNCDGVIVPVYSAVTNNGNCGAQTITRTWTATDACGNSATCSQTITVLGSGYSWASLPPQHIPIQCAEEATDLGPLELLGGCGGGTIEVVAVTNQAQNGCTTTFTVIWDAAPLGLSCPPTPLAYTTSFQAVDTTDPVLSGCPGNLTVDCNDPIPAPANVTASDNCDGVIVPVYSAVTNNGNCGAQTITRTWTATDACGNSATCSQTITVLGSGYSWASLPPQHIPIQCAEEATDLGPLELLGGCGGGTIEVVAVTNQAQNGCTTTFTVIWDAAPLGLSCPPTPLAYTTSFQAVDTTDPVLSGCPGNLTVDCNDPIPAPANVTASDNCDGVIVPVYSAVTNNGNCGAQTITRTWTATDACGNSATCSQTITVLGSGYSWASLPPQHIPIQCAEEATDLGSLELLGGCGGGTIEVVAVTNQAQNGCTTTFTVIWDAAPLGLSCPPTPLAYTTSFQAVDTTDPVLSGCPGNLTVDCNDPIPAPANVTASDNCDGVIVPVYSAVTNNGNCGARTIARTWTATDACGNSATCSQTITVLGSGYSWASLPPQHIPIQCAEEATDLGPLELLGGCGGGTIEVVAVTNQAQNGCTTTFTVIWDAAPLGLSCPPTPLAYTTSFQAVDTTDPVLSGCPGNLTVDCNDPIPAPANVTASDNCDGVIVPVYSAVTNNGNCGAQTITRTWTATDACGNSATCSQTITVLGSGYSWASLPPQHIPIQCAEEATDLGPLELLGGCGGGTIEVVAVTNQAQNGCTTTFTVIWDAAPLGLSCPPTPLAYTTSFQAVDTTDPVLSGCPGNLTVDCNDPVPAPANVTASDNCDGVIVPVYSAVTNNGNCGAQTITRTWTATDACGNSATCSQTITVLGSGYSWASLPPQHIPIQCAEEATDLGPLELLGGCGGGTIEVVAVTNQAQNGCTTTFTVIWDAAPLGLSCPPTPLAYTTSFQAVDTQAPVLVGCPGAVVVKLRGSDSPSGCGDRQRQL